MDDVTPRRFKKEKLKPQKKRTTLHMNRTVYNQLKVIAEEKNTSMLDYLGKLCNEITNGLRDDYIVYKPEVKSVSINQAAATPAREYLKEAGGDSLVYVLQRIISDEYKAIMANK